MGDPRKEAAEAAWAALKGATYAVLSAISGSETPGGASMGHMGFLHALAAAGRSMTPGELAAKLGVTPATVTGALTGMEAVGLVVRERDPGDRRAVHVTITPKGRAARDQWIATVQGRLREVLSPLSESELRTVADLLSKVAPPIHGPPPGLLKSMRHDAPPRTGTASTDVGVSPARGGRRKDQKGT